MNPEDCSFQGAIYGSLLDKESLLETLREMERQNIWLQPFPCWVVLDKRLLKHAAYLAILDFQKETHIAQKLNVQTLLRFAGTTQIRDAINKFDVKEGEPIVIVLLAKEGIKQKIKKRLVRNGIISSRERKQLEAKVNLRGIQVVYDLSPRYVHAIRKGRGYSKKEALVMAIMEKMALLPLQ
ncbi:MAG: hypothetical protein GWO20_20000 [Candidatus Korarchaeota archaeon]|nr:hypothetical protein [Candidatus Korarchaeota archaeon]NIU85514.1 hypothetical protein [Candidatus Thorarchaeota archaeon]NIW15631.1 hypothetical protein [Candidatus Thorarchaeota archaeon]NIW53562.1 hypothetical protein [Candidatus Korarchaeota archaeon]